MTNIDRRTFVVGSTGIMAAAMHPASCSAAVNAKVLETRIISHLSHRYHGWPTLARRSNGELLLVCSGGRESHVCPFGRVELMRSQDGGRTWSWPQTVIDGPIDDRDAGVVETATGSILITTFTSLAYENTLAAAEKEKRWEAPRLRRWKAAHQRVDDKQRKQSLGVWMIRSTDGGLSFSQPYRCQVNSPHGPLQLGNGKLLYAGKELWAETSRIGVCTSTNDGRSWGDFRAIPTRPGDDGSKYHELHAVECSDGKLVAHIRNHNQANSGETLQSESSDDGRTWSTPRAIGVWGLPSHLLRLRDGRLLMSYGHRRRPLGNQARVSTNGGQTWSQPLLISQDGASGDLGYPSTVELDDGTLVTIWYERLKSSPYAVLRQARWLLRS